MDRRTAFRANSDTLGKPEMWKNNPRLVKAIAEAKRWLEIEKKDKKNPVEIRAAAVRTVSKSAHSVDTDPIQTVAYAMIAAGLDLNVDDLAWLVRDKSIGHPERPSFPF